MPTLTTDVLLLRGTAISEDVRRMEDGERIDEIVIRFPVLASTHTNGASLCLLLDGREIELIRKPREIALEADRSFAVNVSMTMEALRCARIGLVLAASSLRPKLYVGSMSLDIRPAGGSALLPYRCWPFCGWLLNDRDRRMVVISLQGRDDEAPPSPVNDPGPERCDDPIQMLAELGNSTSSTYPEGGGSIRA